MAKVPLDVVWLEWQSNGGGANSAWTDAYLCRNGFVHDSFSRPSMMIATILSPKI